MKHFGFKMSFYGWSIFHITKHLSIKKFLSNRNPFIDEKFLEALLRFKTSSKNYCLAQFLFKQKAMKKLN